MKKIIIPFLVALTLLSCSISEQIIFNSDGSGKLSYTIDMSKMIAVTKELDKSDKMTKELTEGTDKDMDSTIAFKDIAKAYQKEGKKLSAEQEANIDKMKNFSMRMIVNKEKSEIKYIMYSDFDKISDIGNIGSALSTFKNVSGKDTGALGGLGNEGAAEVKFAFAENSFSRIVEQKPYIEEKMVVTDTTQWEMEEISDSIALDSINTDVYMEEVIDSTLTEDIQIEENNETPEVEEVDFKQMEKDFKKMGELMKKAMEDSAYEFQYTFTKKIKNVSLPKSSYKLSDDKKTIFIKYKFEEFAKKIKDLNLNIDFE